MMNIVRHILIDNKEQLSSIKKAVAAITALLLILIIGIVPNTDKTTIFAAEGEDQTTTAISDTDSEKKAYVIDDAGILSTSEEESLTELCKKASEKCQLDIIIITMNKNLDYSPMDMYLRSILEKQYGYYGTGSNCEAVVYGIDMTSRADRIVTSGRAKSDISQKQLEGKKLKMSLQMAITMKAA